MFEIQYDTKDLTALKNKISTAIPEGFGLEIYNEDITITGPKRKKIVFKGKLYKDIAGCKIKGEFPLENIISRVAMVIVVIYIAVLLFTYAIGQTMLDSQVALMIVGLVVLLILKNVASKNVSKIKNMFEELK